MGNKTPTVGEQKHSTSGIKKTNDEDDDDDDNDNDAENVFAFCVRLVGARARHFSISVLSRWRLVL